MANLPRLPPTVEHHAVRFLCGLPPRMQRLLFGKPPVIDGQQLAPDIHALLWLDRLVGDESHSEGKGVEETRTERLKEARIVAHRPPMTMERVEALELPGPARPIGARLYTPPRQGAPASGQDPSPLLVYFHGGGWVIGDLDTHDDPCRFLAANAGVKVLSVDYRLAPEHPFPAAAEDALAAYDWAVANAGRLGADPSRVAVGGDSAGGNLAAGQPPITAVSGQDGPVWRLLRRVASIR